MHQALCIFIKPVDTPLWGEFLAWTQQAPKRPSGVPLVDGMVWLRVSIPVIPGFKSQVFHFLVMSLDKLLKSSESRFPHL